MGFLLSHHLGFPNDKAGAWPVCIDLGREALIRAGGGVTAWVNAFGAFGYNVGGSLTEGRLLGVPAIFVLAEIFDPFDPFDAPD